MIRGVLFLCIGNACRSQMAEGFARQFLPPDIDIFSAGTAPAAIDPRAVKVMAEVGVDISTQRSKAIAEVPFDRVNRIITLCGDAADHCPAIPGIEREHWPLPDPAQAQGTPDEVMGTFRAVRAEIRRRVLELARPFGHKNRSTAEVSS